MYKLDTDSAEGCIQEVFKILLKFSLQLKVAIEVLETMSFDLRLEEIAHLIPQHNLDICYRCTLSPFHKVIEEEYRLLHRYNYLALDTGIKVLKRPQATDIEIEPHI